MKEAVLSEKQVTNIIDNVEQYLLNSKKLKFTYDTNWKLNFPEEPGVYAAFENSELLYIGQTADLRSRMSDIRRTYNHTLRKKIGLSRLKGVLNKDKFSDEIESKLTEYMVKYIAFTFHSISFGRLEVESFLVKKYEAQLINSKSVRGLK